MTAPPSAAARRAFFFLVLSASLIVASLLVELLWRSHVRDAIDLGPSTPSRMQGEIATELQLFGIGMTALAAGRILLVLPTGVFWALWLGKARRTFAVVGAWSACTLATLGLWANSFREIRALSGRSAPGLGRETALRLQADAADISVRTDLALLIVAAAALLLVKRAPMRPPSVPPSRVTKD